MFNCVFKICSLEFWNVETLLKTLFQTHGMLHEMCSGYPWFFVDSCTKTQSYMYFCISFRENGFTWVFKFPKEPRNGSKAPQWSDCIQYGPIAYTITEVWKIDNWNIENLKISEISKSWKFSSTIKKYFLCDYRF